MPEVQEREAKLIQYLTEAHGKEKELETALEAHIAMTTRASYKRRLQQHLRETKEHARGVERRIKQLGGDGNRLAEAAEAVQVAARKGMALAQGPLHMVRGTGEQEKLLKNAKTEYSEEAEEIATYTAIETLAEVVGDRETAQLARSIRRDEERMAKFLENLIPTLTRAVAQDEIPASQRNGGRRTRRRSTASRRRSTRRRS
jgi:ferritin-like metal-binding protein YciE